MALYATLNENNHICIYPDNEDFLGVQRMEFPLGIHLLNLMYLDIDEIARTLLDDPSISFIELYHDYSDIANHI